MGFQDQIKTAGLYKELIKYSDFVEETTDSNELIGKTILVNERSWEIVVVDSINSEKSLLMTSTGARYSFNDIKGIIPWKKSHFLNILSEIKLREQIINDILSDMEEAEIEEYDTIVIERMKLVKFLLEKLTDPKTDMDKMTIKSITDQYDKYELKKKALTKAE